jgi:putative DNA primase/helicase
MTLRRTNAELDAEVVQLDESRAANTTPQPQILPPPSAPMAVAREFVEDRCLFGPHLTLRYWRAGWWTWNRSHWTEVGGRTARSALYQYTEHAVYLTAES